MGASNLILLIAELMDVSPADIDEGSGSSNIGRWDSQREVELAMLIEQTYGVEIGPIELSTRFHSVRDIRALLSSRGIVEE